jgi:hypothetical protein
LSLPARLPDWPERLADTIKAASGRPFSWGAHDCALFAADCARAITGVDPLTHVRGEYASARGAARVLRRLGCDDVAQLAALVAGPEVPLVGARRGDWVLCPPTDGVVLGVCLGARAAFVMENGVTFRPTLDCAAAWKIGE